MTKVKIALTILITAVLLASCGGVTGFSNPVEVANDAASARMLLPAIEAGFVIGEDREGVSVSRTISTDYDDDGSDDWTDPDAAYGAGSGTVTIGGVTPLNKFYGRESYKARFDITPDDSTYKIVLRIYPTADFDIAYQEETYWVRNDAWTPYPTKANAVAGTNAFLLNQDNIKVYYTDGTVGTQNVIENSYTPEATDFSQIALPPDGSGGFDIVELNKADYLTLDSVVADLKSGNYATIRGDWEPSGTGATYALIAESEIPSLNLKGIEFYAEHDVSGDTVISSLNISTRRTWQDLVKVTRFRENLDTGEFAYRSLERTVNAWWNSFELDERDVELVGGLLHYTSANQIFYSSSPDLDNDRSTILDAMDLTETAADSGEFAGTLTSYWGRNGEVYNISITRNPVTGLTNLVQSWVSSAPKRGIGDDVSITLDNLSGNDSVQFVFPTSSAQFDGTFAQGELIGSYILGSRSIDIRISSYGVEAGGQFFPYSELAIAQED
jgi:hypothetical protein